MLVSTTTFVKSRLIFHYCKSGSPLDCSQRTSTKPSALPLANSHDMSFLACYVIFCMLCFSDMLFFGMLCFSGMLFSICYVFRYVIFDMLCFSICYFLVCYVIFHMLFSPYVVFFFYVFFWYVMFFSYFIFFYFILILSYLIFIVFACL